MAVSTDKATNGAGSCQQKESDEELPQVDIVISNVVCSFSVRCHLNLREIALTGFNVEYRKEMGVLIMKLRQPYSTATIWSSGKITCTGACTEDSSKIAARRIARILQKLGYNCAFKKYRIVNVLGSCRMPFAINLRHFTVEHSRNTSYEPEIHPGATYRITNPFKATLKLFSTGSITVAARNVALIQSAIEHIYPLVSEFSLPLKDTKGKRSNVMDDADANSTKYRRIMTHSFDDEQECDSS